MDMEQGYRPSHDSLTFRANLARLVSPLRRVRPRVPFYQLAAHRIPTLWTLYRGLLRKAPTDDIKCRVRMAFRRNQHLTGTSATRQSLLQGYKFLDAFKRANGGDERQKLILDRYSRLIVVKSDKEYWKHLGRNEVAWQNKLRNRPIMTGGYMRPSFFNPPLPRLKPQPIAITNIVLKRRKKRVRRLELASELKDNIQDLKLETEFEEGLAKLVARDHRFSPTFGRQHLTEWLQPLQQARAGITEKLNCDVARKDMQYTPEMLEAIKAARREKVVNKTRELSRERRGEVLRRTILRQSKGPPAHVLAKMTPEQRKMDKVARSVSEVGYVAQVKRKLGFKLRDPEAWKMEIGSLKDKTRLNRMSKEFSDENARRTRDAVRQEQDIRLKLKRQQTQSR